MSVAQRQRPTITHGAGVFRNGPVVVRGRQSGMPAGRAAARVLFVVLLVFSAYWTLYTFRHALAEAVPETYPLLKTLGFAVDEPVGFGLAIASGTLHAGRARDEYNQPLLTVRGVLVNTSSERRQLPRLRIEVSGRGAAAPVVWLQDLSEPSLAPGERLRFESRYRSGAVMRNLSVRVTFVRRSM
jgi:hypothetical protein